MRTGPGMLGCTAWPCSLQHTLVWGEITSVMPSSGRGTLSCHSQGEANLPPLSSWV